MRKIRRKSRIWNLIYTLFVIITMYKSVRTYQLRAPSVYFAFSGDLNIEYTVPRNVSIPNAFIRLVLKTDSLPAEITNLGMDSKYSSSYVTVTCGIIEVAGQYEFQMYMYSGGPILTSATVIVRWPETTLTLPETHYSHGSSVRLIYNSSAVCDPRLKRYNFSLDLDYAANVSGISTTGKHDVIYSQQFDRLSANNFLIEFPCTLFNMAGLYRVSLKSSASAISVISRSNIMLIENNPKFRINIWSETIFPCNNVLMVNYLQPQCPGKKEENKIRMYMQRRKSSGSLAASIEKIYIQERQADPDRTYIAVNCTTFNTTAAGYCFQFVTVTRYGGIVVQNEVCRSAHPDSVLPVDGGWGGWTQWSDCSVDCGEGKQSRYRMCDSPTPNFGGAFCEGTSIQWRPCNVFCPDTIPLTPLHSPKLDESCICGCKLDKLEGQIIASGRCNKLSKWLIVAPESHFVKLTFTYFSLYKNKQWVKVRNGGRQDSDLIAYSNGRNDIAHVTSTSNQVLVEFYSESSDDIAHVTNVRNTSARKLKVYSIKPTKPIHVHGFIVMYTTNETDPGMYPVAAIPIKEAERPSIWESMVTIVGIALCGVVVIIAVSFVIYHRTCHRRQHKYAKFDQTDPGMYPVAAIPIKEAERPSIWESMVTIVGIALCGVVVIIAVSFVIYHRTCHRRQHKYAMAAHEESPKRMCKSTSMGSSPSHESHHGIEIEHDMEVPLTGTAHSGDRKKPYTPGSTKSRTSLGSTSSHTKKKYKTKADIEHRPSSRGSPITPNRDYMLLHSSQRKLSKPHDLTQDSVPNSLFRTSPLLKAKVPRSPKVHPSPKIRKSKTPNDEIVHDTKHEMLSKRLQGDKSRENNERVVMGSDFTPTNSIKSPPSVSDSVKTDSETPTNINISKDLLTRKSGKTSDTGLTNGNSVNNVCTKPSDIQLRDIDKHEYDDDRKPASGTSDESTSTDKDVTSLMTTSFIENGHNNVTNGSNGTKPRRPTSLTESYSKMSLASSLGKISDESAKTNGIENNKDKKMSSYSIHSTDDRQKALPKPDGQSPKSPRVEVVKNASDSSKNSSPAKHSKTSTPRSVRSVKSDKTDTSSNKTKSPARSTPSDVVELEYDDFIDMDDTYSYFDPLETEKLTWHGVERVATKTPSKEQK